MKSQLTLILLTLISLSAFAGNKPTVTLTESGCSMSGSVSGDKLIKRKMIRNILTPNSLDDKINIDDKINFLENQIAFYRLMASKNIDLQKSITAAYADKPLKQICEELIPGIPIEFQGADPNETVGSMEITKTPLEQVLQYLDEAAGVNFSFSNKGILVQSGP
jgi:hypothetical protein